MPDRNLYERRSSRVQSNPGGQRPPAGHRAGTEHLERVSSSHALQRGDGAACLLMRVVNRLASLDGRARFPWASSR